MSDGGGMTVTFHQLPDIAREQIVFPKGVLERIERNTITFAENARALLAAGRHLRRGVFLRTWRLSCPCPTPHRAAVCSLSTARASMPTLRT